MTRTDKRAGVSPPKKASDLQRDQHELVEEARRLPGIAEVLDTYGRLAPYTITNPQPSQIRNATGANG
jgi:hypothetical protein